MIENKEPSGQIISFSGWANAAEVFGLLWSPDILQEFLKNMDNSAHKTLVHGVILEQINRLKWRLQMIAPWILDKNIKYFPINLSSFQEVLIHLDSLSILTNKEFHENSTKVARILTAVSDFISSWEVISK